MLSQLKILSGERRLCLWDIIMTLSTIKLTFRSIRSFFGRYMALLLIVALSVGFFAGLKITRDAMTNTGDVFLRDHEFYDYRLLSTLGFTSDDVSEFEKLEFTEKAEGTYTADLLMEYSDNVRPYKLMALTDKINLVSLVSGKMPEKEWECLADSHIFSMDDIGKTITVSSENTKEDAGLVSEKEYTITGICDSPLYINIDRGASSIGSGALAGFLYITPECFTSDVFTEIDITLCEHEKIYSDKYNDLIEKHKNEVTSLCKSRADIRYQDLIDEYHITPELAESFGLLPPETYVLTRSENSGYVNFENDTTIVSGIANIFPIFFILIAMLVCITTMTRMVDEERTQIGVLKAMGFSNFAINLKYMLYAGSATFIGWFVGFFLGTWGLPKVFWFVYNVLYDFSPIYFLFDFRLAALTLAVSLVGILGSTWFSCRRELISVPASLIRPKAAKAGKRVLLERITPIWNRMSFLNKVTIRNMFRYKQRFIMMLVGIGCCAGLVATAFGVRDSMLHVGDTQFEEIQKYSFEVQTDTEVDPIIESINKLPEAKGMLAAHIERADLVNDNWSSSLNLAAFDDMSALSDFWDLHSGESKLACPEKGEALISVRASVKLSLKVGDVAEIRNADMQTYSVKITGIFDNYVDNYVIISSDTYAEAFGEYSENTLLLVTDTANLESTAEELLKIEGVTGVKKLADTQKRVDDALSCIDYVIWLVVLFSGALAFIVIFNLTNINLAERSREVATVEVLGFYPKETESYVLKENMILSFIASFIGIPLGTLFHRAVMSMIVIDFMYFDMHITALSYLLSVVCTIIFAIAVNIFMKRQILKIKMVESLKAVE